MSESTYGLSPEKSKASLKDPGIPYLPPIPRGPIPAIGVIGAGGIAGVHLTNYKAMKWPVRAIADIDLAMAQSRRDEFFPGALATANYRDILENPEIAVVDINPHVKQRVPLVREALRAGKHVLSQKPFVMDLEVGRELVNLANEKGVLLCVNQNGRWAPHFSYLRKAVAAGQIGEVVAVDFSVGWDHTWVQGKPMFENMEHLVLLDFAIHWFDILQCFMGGRRAKWVFAAEAGFSSQVYQAPSLASVIVQYPEAQARMSFNAHTQCGEEDTTTITGTRGVLRARGPGLNDQRQIEIHTAGGAMAVSLEGHWFEQGFQGTMGELLCALEEQREPEHSASNNLGGLELCLAALKSAKTGSKVSLSI